MFLSKTKWVNLLIAFCFAILQAFQPFVHAHTDSDHDSHHAGFHLGDNHEGHFSVNDHHFDDNSVSIHSDTTHTISVDTSLKHESNNATLVKGLFVLLLIVCFSLYLQSTHRLNPAFLLVSNESLRRLLPASRAPPKY